MAASASPRVDPAVANLQARQFVKKVGVDWWNAVASGVIATGAGSVVNVPGRNVGLVKRFLIKLSFEVTASAQAQTLGPFGPSSAVSNVLLTDLSNQIRINAPGWLLSMISTAKRRRVFGAAFTSDTPLGFGNNFTAVMSAPASIAGAGTGIVDVFFEVPVSYTDEDLRGAIWAAVVNGTFNLQFTINPNMFANSGTTDSTQALYVSAGADSATVGDITYTIYQNVLDQLTQYSTQDPQTGARVPILPYGDIGVAYMLNSSPFSAIVASQDNPFPYPNFRDIMSTTVVFDNGGDLNVGSDVNYWALQSANFTNIFKYDPLTAALMTRQIIGDDPPPGMYYFDHRLKPINTLQYGNMALLLNPSLVNAGASILFGVEMLATIGMVTNAGSLAGT